MSQKTFTLTAGVVFLLIALGHLLRILLGGTLVIEGFPVPMWVSALAFVVMGYLGYQGFWLATKPKSGQ